MWHSLSRLPVCAERNAHFDGHNGTAQTISTRRHFLTRGHYSLHRNHLAIHCAFQSVLLCLGCYIRTTDRNEPLLFFVCGNDLFVYGKQ